MKNPLDFSGKVVIVTGARSGIGKAIATMFGEQGAKVACVGRRPCDDTVKAIKKVGSEAISVPTDVSQEDQVSAMVKTVVDTFGKVDILVNNAGSLPPTRPLTEQTTEDFDKTMAIDVRGVFLGMKYVIPELKKVGGGAIVNIASVAGLVADPGMAPYVAAKHAVVGLTKSSGIEYADQGIRINGIAPGFVATEMTQGWMNDPKMKELVKSYNFQHRIADPSEIAGAALYLASPLASFMSGAIIAVDAGQTAH